MRHGDGVWARQSREFKLVMASITYMSILEGFDKFWKCYLYLTGYTLVLQCSMLHVSQCY